MKPIKIVVTDYIEPDLKWEEEELGKYGHVTFEVHQLKFRSEPDLVETIVDADMILVNMVKMTASVIDQLERCRLILRHGVGYDNVDVSAATKKGIRVAYEPDYCSDEVAEHAITLMLAGWRKLNVGRRILEASSRTGYGTSPTYIRSIPSRERPWALSGAAASGASRCGNWRGST